MQDHLSIAIENEARPLCAELDAALQSGDAQALQRNASPSPKTHSGEILHPGTPESERTVEPLSREDLAGKSLSNMHGIVMSDLGVLDAISREGQEVVRKRLMVVFDEMARRFEAGEKLDGIRGKGGKGMGKYLRSIGFNPAKLRQWKFQLRKDEMLRLAKETAPPAKKKQRDVITLTETEADILAKAGVKMARLLTGNSIAPEGQKRKAEALAKEIVKSVEGGEYERFAAMPVLAALASQPEADSDDETDNWYVNTCLRFVEATLKSLESDSERYQRVTGLIAGEVLEIAKGGSDNPSELAS